MKKSKINILVFPCGSEIGLAIHDCLKYSTFFNIIGLSSVQDHGAYVFENYIEGAPLVTNDNIIDFLREVIDKYAIDAIYPAMDLVSNILKNNEQKLGCKVIASCCATSEICLSKEKTYDILRNVIPVPLSFNPKEITEFPIFIKPKIGYGSRGTHLIKSHVELQPYLNNDDILFLEYLPGIEYTVDCFTDKNGKLLFSKARSRDRIRNGISVHTKYIEDNSHINLLANKINETLKFNGAWFFQLKEDSNGDLKLLEVADRFGGSSLLAKAIGVNLPLLTLFNAFDYNVEITPNNYPVQLDRALSSSYKLDIKFNTVYVDFDDCLIIDNEKVNVELVSFLYKCMNDKKEIILLTKHSRNIEQSLKKFRLHGLFDNVIHIKAEENKSKYIKNNNSIFIDDSFAERESVRKIKNIPVFSPEMIDVLM